MRAATVAPTARLDRWTPVRNSCNPHAVIGQITSSGFQERREENVRQATWSKTLVYGQVDRESVTL
jgi:hypothetical protein